jgi:hypothetical protein
MIKKAAGNRRFLALPVLVFAGESKSNFMAESG